MSSDTDSAVETYNAEVDWLYRTTWNVALSSAVASHTEAACKLYHLTSEILGLMSEENAQLLQSRKVW